MRVRRERVDDASRIEKDGASETGRESDEQPKTASPNARVKMFLFMFFSLDLTVNCRQR